MPEASGIEFGLTVIVSSPGGANDLFPFIPRLALDPDNTSPHDDTSRCGSTLIAPRLLVTAGHCVAGLEASGTFKPVYADFGKLGRHEVKSWRVHGNYGAVGSAFPFDHDVAVLELETAPETTPLPLLLPQADIGDKLLHVGYAKDRKAFGLNRVDGFSTIAAHRVDGLIYHDYDLGEIQQQPGDSGGPGLYAARDNQGGRGLPRTAYPENWDARGRDLFVTSVHHGRVGFRQFNSRIDDDPARNVDGDNLEFLLSAMPLPWNASDVLISHSFPDNLATLPHDTELGILISAFHRFGGEDYVFNPVLWHEDSGSDDVFSGNMHFGLNSTGDDLVGFGFDAGRLPDSVQAWVHAYDFVTVAELLQIKPESGAKWRMSLQANDGIHTFALDDTNHVSRTELDRRIERAQQDALKDRAVISVFEFIARVPEPPSLALGLLSLAICRMSAAASRRRIH